MKKILILVAIALLCVLTTFTIIKGLHIGNFSIMGLQEIKEEDEKLDKKVTDATVKYTDYKSQISDIDKDIKEMKLEKQTYEDMIATSTESEIASVVQKQKYTIDKLWTRIGTLATDEGLDAKFVYKKGTLQAAENEDFNYYSIDFEVTGSYVGISLYISDLEDDSELGFKIDDFSMTPVGNGEEVKATFTVKDIAIEGIADMKEETKTDEADENTTDNTTKEKGSIINAINTTVEDVTAENTTNVTENKTSQ